jgi:hypothetical protein
MPFDVGDRVRLPDNRTGRISRITAEGNYDVNLDDETVEDGGFLAENVPAEELTKISDG